MANSDGQPQSKPSSSSAPKERRVAAPASSRPLPSEVSSSSAAALPVEQADRVEGFFGKLKRHPVISVFLIIGVIVIALASFTDAIESLRKLFPVPQKKVTAVLETEKGPNGSEIIQIKFLDAPEHFSVERIVFGIEVVKVGPVTGNPSGKVEPVLYDLRISDEILADDKPTVTFDPRLYHDSKEPYAMARITLWWDKMDSRATFRLRPTFLDTAHKPIDLIIRPEMVEVTLENRRLISAQPKAGAHTP